MFAEIKLPKLLDKGSVQNTFDGIKNGLFTKLHVKIYRLIGLIVGVIDDKYCVLTARTVDGNVPAIWPIKAPNALLIVTCGVFATTVGNDHVAPAGMVYPRVVAVA